MRVVHVIGLVGAGKTYFINKWFPKISEIFDIKMVYEQHNFSPETLQGNPKMYSAFKNVLRDYLSQFIERYKSIGFFIAESSGANGVFNQIFQELDEYRILIEPNYDQIKKVVENQRRDYAKKLNEYLSKKYELGEILFDNSYDPATNLFRKPLPNFLKNYFS